MKIRYSMSHKPLGQPVRVGVCTRRCVYTCSCTHTRTCTHVLVMGEGKPVVMGAESGEASWIQGLVHRFPPEVCALEGIQRTVDAEEDLRSLPLSPSAPCALSELRPLEPDNTVPLVLAS